MRFTLEIELGNEAMRTFDHVADALYGVRQLMQGLDEPDSPCSSIIRDVNGNTVGMWEVVE